MSIEKIVAEAIDNNPLKMKEAFEEEMNGRIRAALEEKYKKMMKKEDDEDEDDDDDEDDDEDDDDEDEDDDDEIEEKKRSNRFQLSCLNGYYLYLKDRLIPSLFPKIQNLETVMISLGQMLKE